LQALALVTSPRLGYDNFGAIFNLLVAYQVLEHVEEIVITIFQINVEEVNGSTSDGIQ
jgi:hypothetical protein